MNTQQAEPIAPPNESASAPGAPAAPHQSVGAMLRRLGPAGPLAIIASTLPSLGFLTLVSLLSTISPWLREQGGVGVAIFIGGFAILAGIAVLPTHASAILGGWAFGFAVGLPATTAGFVAAALIGYGIARRAAGQRVVEIIREHPKWQAVYEALLGGSFGKTLLIVILLRLPPNSPFAISNLVLAATRVPPAAYLLGTLFGMLPRMALVVWIAAHLSKLDFNAMKSWWLAAAGIASTLVVFAIIGVIAARAVRHVTDTPAPKPPK